MEKDRDNITENDPVTAVARKEKELTGHDLERARDGNDLGEKFGRQNIGSTVVNKSALESKKKEDEKFENALRQLLQQMQEELERRLEELDRLIADNNAKIEELREELVTIETRLEKQFGRDWQEKLKRGELDPNDPLLRQWLMQQQQLKDYQDRREKLINERDELEKHIAEIEGANLPDQQKLEKMRDVLEHSTSASVHKVWQDDTMSQQGQLIAGTVHTEDYSLATSQESGNGMFAQLTRVSFAGKAGISQGIEIKVESIKSKFGKAVEPGLSGQFEQTNEEIPTIKGPKLPG
jgi:hypothetical protein